MLILRPVGLEPKSATGTRALLALNKRLLRARIVRIVIEENMVAEESVSVCVLQKRVGVDVNILYTFQLICLFAGRCAFLIFSAFAVLPKIELRSSFLSLYCG
jgi:hypothetical protein